MPTGCSLPSSAALSYTFSLVVVNESAGGSSLSSIVYV